MPWLLRRVIRVGSVTLVGSDGRTESFVGSAPGPEIAIRITDPGFDWKLLRGPTLAVAEAYMDGTLVFERGGLRELLELTDLNMAARRTTAAESACQRLLRVTRRFLARNTPGRARRNAAAHYDLGDDLYRLFLDGDMQYSCGYFPTGRESLEAAQLAKKRLIAAKLLLRPGQRVLDIGCGWGGLAVYLAEACDVEVLGITLAENQLTAARQRAKAAGLADRVRFELADYRKVGERFDRIVSVGMMEHVGHASFGAYFDAVAGLLAPDGVALIHAIFRMEPPSITNPFTLKYIFPGGYIPALSETMAAVERSRLWLLDCEVWRKHYAFTLRQWYARFMAARDRARALYDERFCRMWELFLLGSEASFLSGAMTVMQLQLGHKRDAVPLTRDYLAAELERLSAREPGLAA